MGFNADLADLVNDTAYRVDRWTTHAAWTIEPRSPAAAEIANAETMADGTPWGDRPVRTAYAYAQMAMKLTVEFSRCAAMLIRADRPAPGIETMARSALEAGSVAWWLMAPGLTARQRVCRLQLLRRNSARELEKSAAETGQDADLPDRERVPGIEAECRAFGLGSFTEGGDEALALGPFTRGGDELEGEVRLKYTARVKALTDELGNQGAYSIYSGSAHAELSGLWRLLAQTGATLSDRQPLYGATANPKLTRAAAFSTLKALMGPAERTAILFGWPGTAKADEFSAVIEHINSEMKRLPR